MDQVEISLPRTKVVEGDSFAVTANFRDRTTSTGAAPTTVDYRVDCLTTGIVVKGWTAAAVDASVDISMDSSFSAIQSRANKTERKQLTVRANKDGFSQVSGRARWIVANQDFMP